MRHRLNKDMKLKSRKHTAKDRRKDQVDKVIRPVSHVAPSIREEVSVWSSIVRCGGGVTVEVGIYTIFSPFPFGYESQSMLNVDQGTISLRLLASCALGPSPGLLQREMAFKY